MCIFPEAGWGEENTHSGSVSVIGRKKITVLATSSQVKL